MKKLLSLVLALALVLCVFVIPASAETKTITMLQRLPASYVVEGNPVIKA